MKTFCLTFGLLVLTFCCCNAIPSAMECNTASPGNCCFKFSTVKIPLVRVNNITKTHKCCLKKGFIVTTVLKRQICYTSNFDWALKILNNFDNTEGSSMQ